MQETSASPSLEYNQSLQSRLPQDQSSRAAFSRLHDIQLLVIDLDGTTVGVSNQIQPAVYEAIQQARQRGVKVAIATGRMYCSALRFYQELQLTLPLMAYQGALIQDPATGYIHQHLTVPQAYVLELLELLDQPALQDSISLHLYINDRLYVRAILPETEAYALRSSIEPIPVGDLRQVLQVEPTKVLALSRQVDLINDLLRTLQQRYTPSELYLTKSVDTFLEATHPLVNKGTAVQYLAEEVLGLQAENVMVIGDNFNDLEMLQYAGIGVAMGNAPEGVKAIANWIAPDVEQDGVAAAITEFLL